MLLITADWGDLGFWNTVFGKEYSSVPPECPEVSVQALTTSPKKAAFPVITTYGCPGDTLRARNARLLLPNGSRTL